MIVAMKVNQSKRILDGQ